MIFRRKSAKLMMKNYLKSLAGWEGKYLHRWTKKLNSLLNKICWLVIYPMHIAFTLLVHIDIRYVKEPRINDHCYKGEPLKMNEDVKTLQTSFSFSLSLQTQEKIQ